MNCGYCEHLQEKCILTCYPPKIRCPKDGNLYLTTDRCKYESDVISSKDIVEVLRKAQEKNPYKVFGVRETYSSYNEGWNDALEYIASSLHLDY